MLVSGRLSTRLDGYQRPKHLLCVEVSIFVDSICRALRPGAPEERSKWCGRCNKITHRYKDHTDFFSNGCTSRYEVSSCTTLYPQKKTWTRTHRTIHFKVHFRGSLKQLSEIFSPSYHTTWQHWCLDGVGHWIHAGWSTNWCVGILCLTENFAQSHGCLDGILTYCTLIHWKHLGQMEGMLIFDCPFWFLFILCT